MVVASQRGDRSARKARSGHGRVGRDRVGVRPGVRGGGSARPRPLPPREGARGGAPGRDRRVADSQADRRARRRSTTCSSRRGPLDMRGRRRRLARVPTSRSGSCRSSAGKETLRANLTSTFLTARGFLRGGRPNAGTAAPSWSRRPRGFFGEAGHADDAAASPLIAVRVDAEFQERGGRGSRRGARVTSSRPAGSLFADDTRARSIDVARPANHADDASAQGRAGRGCRGTGRRPRLGRDLRARHRPGRHGRRRNGRRACMTDFIVDWDDVEGRRNERVGRSARSGSRPRPRGRHRDRRVSSGWRSTR